jgi:hypothetical protein
VKIAIVRGGGLLGATTRTELDTDQLAADAADTFAQKVDLAAIGAEVTRSGAPVYPDALSYELTVDKDGSTVTATFTDATLPEPVQELVAWIDARPETTTSVELPPSPETDGP